MVALQRRILRQSPSTVILLAKYKPNEHQIIPGRIAGATKMPCQFEELAGATGLKPARRALLFARMQSRSQYQHHDRFHSVTIS